MEENSIKYYTTIFYNSEDRIELTLLDEQMELGLVGMVSSQLFSENIAIVVDDSPQTVEYDFACLAYGKDGAVPRVMVKTELYDDLKQGTAESKTILFHEIGHYVNGDMLINAENAEEERGELVSQNKVSETEIKADAFAVCYLGVDCVMQGLADLRQRILTEYADYDEESQYLATRELDIRIEKLKEQSE